MNADSFTGGQYLNLIGSDFRCLLFFVSHDFELGRTWLTGGVNRQSRTGLILCCLGDRRGIQPVNRQCGAARPGVKLAG